MDAQEASELIEGDDDHAAENNRQKKSDSPDDFYFCHGAGHYQPGRL